MNSDNTKFSNLEKVLLFTNFVIDKIKSTKNKKYLVRNKVKKRIVFLKFVLLYVKIIIMDFII